ncbi:hypothetical protein D1872_306730 [compost metagenome]
MTGMGASVILTTKFKKMSNPLAWVGLAVNISVTPFILLWPVKSMGRPITADRSAR